MALFQERIPNAVVVPIGGQSALTAVPPLYDFKAVSQDTER
jgi:hypothetical protein